MTKYKKYYREMIEINQEAFEAFRQVHERYSLDPKKCQEEYNQEGEKILRIIRDWENRLCRRSQNAGFGHFAGGLSDKFWQEIRNEFPLIDDIGLVVDSEPEFAIKKINLDL